LRQQIQSLREQGPFHAVKLGMVPDRGSLSAVRQVLRFARIPWVIDPVVRTSTGGKLSHLQAADFLRLAGPSRTLTPNAPEARWLLGAHKPIDTREQAAAAAERLHAEGFGAVIVKGGHLLDGPTDVLCWSGGLVFLGGRKRSRTPRHRGTGCRFASALATELALGSAVPRAAAVAKDLVQRFLRTAP
jgi:hydroxymethylpyrimidine/phosphomethylpyrimidine kinase